MAVDRSKDNGASGMFSRTASAEAVAKYQADGKKKTNSSVARRTSIPQNKDASLQDVEGYKAQEYNAAQKYQKDGKNKTYKINTQAAAEKYQADGKNKTAQTNADIKKSNSVGTKIKNAVNNKIGESIYKYGVKLEKGAPSTYERELGRDLQREYGPDKKED